MKLLRELVMITEAKRGKGKTKSLLSKIDKADKDEVGKPATGNFAAKNSHLAGNVGGAHQEKNGKKASRSRQKKNWKKEVRDY